jgi:hypothetical protein
LVKSSEEEEAIHESTLEVSTFVSGMLCRVRGQAGGGVCELCSAILGSTVTMRACNARAPVRANGCFVCLLVPAHVSVGARVRVWAGSTDGSVWARMVRVRAWDCRCKRAHVCVVCLPVCAQLLVHVREWAEHAGGRGCRWVRVLVLLVAVSVPLCAWTVACVTAEEGRGVVLMHGHHICECVLVSDVCAGVRAGLCELWVFVPGRMLVFACNWTQTCFT